LKHYIRVNDNGDRGHNEDEDNNNSNMLHEPFNLIFFPRKSR